MAIKCCNGCVPPKRTDTCHATCPDYIIDSAFHNVEKARENEKREIGNAIYSNRSVKVNNAMRRRRNKKYG